MNPKRIKPVTVTAEKSTNDIVPVMAWESEDALNEAIYSVRKQLLAVSHLNSKDVNKIMEKAIPLLTKGALNNIENLMSRHGVKSPQTDFEGYVEEGLSILQEEGEGTISLEPNDIKKARALEARGQEVITPNKRIHKKVH